MQFVKGGRAAVTKSFLLSLCDLFSLETPGLNFARASCASLRHVLCKCHACIVPVGSSTYNIYSVASLLEEKGWNLATGQFPPCLTICIGERHDEIVNEFSTDLRAAVDFLDATPSYKPSGAAAGLWGDADNTHCCPGRGCAKLRGHAHVDQASRKLDLFPTPSVRPHAGQGAQPASCSRTHMWVVPASHQNCLSLCLHTEFRIRTQQSRFAFCR